MTPSLASLMSCEEEDREVGTAEVMSYFTQGLLGLTHNVLKVRLQMSEGCSECAEGEVADVRRLQ